MKTRLSLITLVILLLAVAAALPVGECAGWDARHDGGERDGACDAERGEQASTPLPEEVTERLRRAEQVMQDASRNLGAGDGPEGLRLQREA